ncbi:MAG TPA: Ig-like domain-containing protein, partial [Thermoplasmata archaeon]|nr:Ig-like domain-containing protein [Thermoplasmata archaeon]
LQAVGSKRSAKEIVKVFATDIAGTSTSTQTLVSFDNDPPVASSVTVYYQGGKGTVQDGGTTHVSARVADIGPVPDLEVRLLSSSASPEVRLFDDGVGNDLVAGDGVYTSPTFTVPLGAPNGANAIQVDSRDAARNLGIAPGILAVSNPPPSVVFFNPQEGGYLQGTSTLLVNVTDDRAYASPEYAIDGKPWKPMASVINNPWNYTGTIDASGMAEGPHNASVRATDSSGNFVLRTIDFTLDLNDPFVMADFPRNGSRVAGNVTVRVFASDSVGVAAVAAQVFGQVFVLALNSQSGFYEASLDTRRFTDGAYDYSIVAFDLSGRFVTDAMRIVIDNSPPRIELVNPRPKSVVGGIVNVQANVDDLGPVVTTYSVGPLSSANITDPWNTSRMEDGEYELTVRARDAAGHESSVTVDVRVDNTAPVIIPLQVPIETDRLKGNVLVRVKAEDAALEVVSMSLVSGPASYLVCSDFRELFECAFNSSVFPDSNYTMLFEARDIVGHVTFLGRNVTVDNSAPSISVAPNPQRILFGDVQVDIQARDISRPVVVEVRVDEGDWIRVPEGSPLNRYPHIWRTESLANGQHRLEVRATDDAGNSATETFRYVVENFRTAPIYFFILLVVGLILFAYGFTRREEVEEVEYFEERGPQYIVVPTPFPQPFVVQVPVMRDESSEEEGEPTRRSAAQRAAERRTEGAADAAAGPGEGPAGGREAPATRTEEVVQRRRVTLEERRETLRGRVEGRR